MIGRMVDVSLVRWNFLPVPLWPSAPSDPACRVRSIADLSTLERRQLGAAIALDPDFPLDDWLAPGFGARHPAFAWTTAAAECPVEWWDVEADGVAVARLFTYAADTLCVLAIDGTERVAMAAQFGSAWEGFEGPFLDRAFRVELAGAHRRVVAAHPLCQLKAYYPLEEEEEEEPV